MDESGKKEKLLLYYDGESISGKVSESAPARALGGSRMLRN